MKRFIVPVALTMATLSYGISLASADDALAPPISIAGAATVNPSGTVIVPSSSVSRPEDVGIRVHTNFLIFKPAAGSASAASAGVTANIPATGAPFPYYYETPQSLACIYGLRAAVAGCNPLTLALANHAVGGSKVIAIVDAYDYPGALSDLNHYSAQFGLPALVNGTTFKRFVPSPTPPTSVLDWNIEAALDIEMAHAMAPSAKIYLVEAKSSSYTDMFAAEAQAANLVAAAGAGEVSNSWGGPEFSGQTTYDFYLKKPNVVYFFSSGDDPSVEYPSSSPFVVAVGGTSTARNPLTGLYLNHEVSWSEAGDGYSTFYLRPAFQATSVPVNRRATPDISADANPDTGVWVYDASAGLYYGGGGWLIVGGTSAAAPMVAGITNWANHFKLNSTAENTGIYGQIGKSPATLFDVVYGVCGAYAGYFAFLNWDFCSGAGTPRGAGAL